MSEKIRTLIVDDEPLARKNIAFLLKSHADIDILAHCANGIQALQAIDAERPDLLFLDVQMPTMNGLEVLAAIPEDQMPLIIFATAYDAYAIQAFDVNAVDYLLKPIEEQRFETALDRARAKYREQQKGQTDTTLQQLLKTLNIEPAKAQEPGQSRLKQLLVKDQNCFVYVDVVDIDTLEAAGNYVAIHQGNKLHLIRETLTHIAERLDPEQFIRVSRSQILNIKQVKAFEPHFQGEYIAHLKRGTQIKMNRRYRQNWQHLFKDAYS
jgi:two-component system LytT family response regulator